MLDLFFLFFELRPKIFLVPEKYFFIIFGLIFLVSFAAPYLHKKFFDKFLQKLLKPLINQTRIASFIGLILTFLRLEKVYILAMPILIYLPIIYILILKSKALYLRYKVYPKKINQSKQQKDAKKYIP